MGCRAAQKAYTADLQRRKDNGEHIHRGSLPADPERVALWVRFNEMGRRLTQ